MTPNELTFVAFVVGIISVGGALRLIAAEFARREIDRVLRDHNVRPLMRRRNKS